jgi:ubiquinone/menaquinone biosynthesis C-methylase UbiE
MAKEADRYSVTYSNFDAGVRSKFRREVYGQDIGQNSWTTADELARFADKAGLASGAHILEVGCGAGGPALYLARRLGLRLTGVDINQAGIEAATAAAKADGLSERAQFLAVDGSGPLPFEDGSFDGVLLIDAIGHIPDRQKLLAEFHRLLRPGGVLLYTDATVVTGPVTAAEFAARSAVGFYVFMPPGENERLLALSGFELVTSEDVTQNAATIASRRIAVSQKYRDELIALEGAESFEQLMKFNQAVHELAASRRLSRLMFLAKRQ